MAVRRTLAPLFASLLLLVGAASCAEDDPEVKIAPSASPTPTAAASASPSAAAETPEEFFERWARLDKQMQNTGETAEYSAITQGCESCADLTERIRGFYDAGGHVQWEGRQILRVERLGRLTFKVWIRSGPTSYRVSKDAPVQRIAGGRSIYQVTLSTGAEGYTLREIVEVES